MMYAIEFPDRSYRGVAARRLRRRALVLAGLVLIQSGVRGAAQPASHPGRPEPRLVPRLTPDDRPGRHEVFVDPRPLPEVAAAYRERHPAPAGSSWVPGPVSAIDLFGPGVRFDRPRLIRLYGPRRVLVARGPILQDGRVVASVTLLSPHPDAAFSTLSEGTLIIVRSVGGKR